MGGVFAGRKDFNPWSIELAVEGVFHSKTE